MWGFLLIFLTAMNKVLSPHVYGLWNATFVLVFNVIGSSEINVCIWVVWFQFYMLLFLLGEPFMKPTIYILVVCRIWLQFDGSSKVKGGG